MATYRDVELLNRSMEGLGDTFRTNRLDKERRERDIRDDLLRREMVDTNAKRADRSLAIEQRRLEAEENRGANQAASAKMEEKQRMLKSVMELAATGVADIASVNAWLDSNPEFAWLQVKEPTKVAPQAGQNAVAQALREAEYWKGKGNTNYATLLEKWADAQSKPKPGELGYVETKTEPETDAMGRSTGKTTTSTTRREPITEQPAATTGTTAPAGKTRMISPDGVPGLVPNDQVEKAKTKGFKLAPPQ